MFEAEALGLKENLRQPPPFGYPNPICWGLADTSAYIVMEWLDLGYGKGDSWQRMGTNLAAMHRVTSLQRFWLAAKNNTIGRHPPSKTPGPRIGWNSYREHRLRYQFKLANRRGGHFPRQDEVY